MEDPRFYTVELESCQNFHSGYNISAVTRFISEASLAYANEGFFTSYRLLHDKTQQIAHMPNIFNLLFDLFHASHFPVWWFSDN